MTDKTKKLPKHIQMMVEKGNLVSAIKNLSSEENISMDEAKSRIDDYEEQVKAERHKKQEIIAQKQAKKSAKKQKLSKSSEVKEQDLFDNLNSSLDQHLSEQGYKKPLVPYWWKRVVIIVLLLASMLGLVFFFLK